MTQQSRESWNPRSRGEYWRQTRWFTSGVLRVVGRKCYAEWGKAWDTEHRIGWHFMYTTIKGTGPHSTKAVASPLAPQERGDLLSAETVPEGLWLRDTRHRRGWERLDHTCQRVSALHPSVSWWSAHQGRRLGTFSKEIRKLQIWGSLTIIAFHTGLLPHFQAGQGSTDIWGKLLLYWEDSQKDTTIHTQWKETMSESKRNKAGREKTL